MEGEQNLQKNILVQTWKSTVITLSKFRVAKMNHRNDLSLLKKEAERIQFANSVNNLFVNCKGIKTTKNGKHQLILERLSVSYTHLTLPTNREV